MYPNYPHDTKAQIVDTCMRAIEGDQSHVLVQSGIVTLSLTANTLLTQNVSFARQFTPSTTPDVVASLNSIGVTTSTIKFLIAGQETEKGFTIQILSDTTQTVKVKWISKGKAE